MQLFICFKQQEKHHSISIIHNSTVTANWTRDMVLYRPVWDRSYDKDSPQANLGRGLLVMVFRLCLECKLN